MLPSSGGRRTSDMVVDGEGRGQYASSMGTTAFSQNLGSAHFFKFFLRGSQERKDLALNPKRVSLAVGKDQQRTCAVMGRKCRVKPVVPRLPGQTFHWSKSAD